MRVAIIGLGKLGSPMAAVFASAGHQVFGADIDTRAVGALNDGRAPVEETDLQAVLNGCSDRITATTCVGTACQDAEIICVIVPTPSKRDGTFSLEFVQRALEPIAGVLAESTIYRVVAIVSTVSPGSMVQLRDQLEQQSGRRCGPDFGLVYNPEFIALGSVIADMRGPDFVLIGERDTRAGDVMQAFYATIHNRPCSRLGWYSAEACKIGLNLGLTLRIAYACTISELCDRLPDGDAWAVMRAIGQDKRIGPAYLKPATGFGGPCFPRDTRAFAATAAEFDSQAWLADACGTVNDHQSARLADMVEGFARRGDMVGILGLTYKPDTSVCEESAGLRLSRELEGRGWDTLGCDPESEQTEVCEASLRDCVQSCSVLVLVTPWPDFASQLPADLAQIGQPRTIIDCWDVLRGRELPDSVTLITLGCGPPSA